MHFDVLLGEKENNGIVVVFLVYKFRELMLVV